MRNRCSKWLVGLAAVLFSLPLFAADNAKKMAPAPTDKPALTRLEPRGMQRGTELKIKLTGSNLAALTNISFSVPQLTAEILPGAKTNEAFVLVKASVDLARGSYELSVKNAAGESGKVKLHLDDLPQVFEPVALPGKAAARKAEALPVSFWGTIETPGKVGEFDFIGVAGQTVVFDLAAESLGSAAKSAILTLVDARGTVLASNNGFDGSTDALIAHTFRAAGRYTVRVGDLTIGASVEHFYRLSVGPFAEVIGVHPLAVPANAETDVELIGYNLPPGARVRVQAGAAGEAIVPMGAKQFHARKQFKVLVGDGKELVESEPNDSPATAMTMPVPSSVSGRLWNNGVATKSKSAKKSAAPALANDVDLYRFTAKAGQTLVLETLAARRGSPADTKIEVLHTDGRPVPRVLLQAVRDSYVTFRAIDSVIVDCRVQNWEEMQLNQFLYLQGEVVKLFRAPQGPDSGFSFYNAGGKRLCYFDTSATAHANDEPCYIVEPHPPGAKLVASGLPVFTVNYVNDDDSERKLGSDSKLYFTAPQDDAYLVRVSDARGFSSERSVYRLTVREARPDFTVALGGAGMSVNKGSGKQFNVTADRVDGFDGDIRVDITGLPAGFTVSTPLVIQAGHRTAVGTLNASTNATAPGDADLVKIKITATANITDKSEMKEAAGRAARAPSTATITDKSVAKDVNSLGKITLADAPKLFVFLEPYDGPKAAPGQPAEITIAPGQIIPARLRVVRNGHTDLITFTVDNLPHGIIVADIGLSGVLIPKGESERQIFLTAAKWVPETDRLCHAQEKNAGNQTSLPVMLHVRRSAAQVSR